MLLPHNSPFLSPPSQAKENTHLKLIPLPIYATLPNEGSTFGIMPVLLKIKTDNQQTESIYAPSLSWNRVIGSTGTFRWYYYPKPIDQILTLTASVSSNVNWGTFLQWQDLPFENGKKTEELTFRIQRSIFFRFFGIGPDIPDDAETSHTRMRGSLLYRKGLNLPKSFNIGILLEASRDIVQREAAPGLPSTPLVFPGIPGMGTGASIVGQSIDLRFDTRVQRDYSLEG